MSCVHVNFSCLNSVCISCLFQLMMSAAGAGGSTSSTSTTPATSCCETGRPIMTDPNTGQTICSCQYSSSLLSYPRVAGLTDTVYGSAYATQGYVPFGTDPSAFYSPLVSYFSILLFNVHTQVFVAL